MARQNWALVNTVVAGFALADCVDCRGMLACHAVKLYHMMETLRLIFSGPTKRLQRAWKASVETGGKCSRFSGSHACPAPREMSPSSSSASADSSSHFLSTQ